MIPKKDKLPILQRNKELQEKIYGKWDELSRYLPSANSKEYADMLSDHLASLTYENAPEIIGAVLRFCTEESNGRITPKTLARISDLNEDLLSKLLKVDKDGKTNLEYENLIKVLEFTLGTQKKGEHIKKPKAYTFLIEELEQDEARKNLAVVILGFMETKDRAGFWEAYKKAPSPDDAKTKFRKISGSMRLIELKIADLEFYQTLEQKEKDEFIKNWELLNDYLEFAKGLLKDPYGTFNIGDMPVSQFLGLLFQFTGGATMLLNLGLNIKHPEKLPTSHFVTGAVMAGFGTALQQNSDPSSQETIDEKNRIKYQTQLLTNLNKNTDSWHELFEDRKFVKFFCEYIKAPERQNSDGQLVLNNVHLFGFTNLLEEKAKDPNHKKYASVLEEWNKNKITNKSLKTFSRIFDKLNIDNRDSYRKNMKQAMEIG